MFNNRRFKYCLVQEVGNAGHLFLFPRQFSRIYHVLWVTSFILRSFEPVVVVMCVYVQHFRWQLAMYSYLCGPRVGQCKVVVVPVMKDKLGSQA